ncbi:Laccase domain protein [Pseudomonas reidholzensis]|uniref:Laccase domain protein n=2 Tax=Pseudomonas reidholzensis TaxID=1785162 RepID=A0A383RUF3_9PSED|nr:Laccase domain protein [Pseudomonas reidholzensis]
MPFLSENLAALPGLSHAFACADDVDKPHDLFYCAQNHGATIIEVGQEHEAGVIAGDAVYTRTSRPIGIVTADCLPIFIGSETEPFVAAIHGGWQGLAAGIIETAFDTFRSAGVSVDDLQIALGPAIHSCCYEVSTPLVDTIEDTHGHLWRARPRPWSTSRKQAGQVPHADRATASHGEAWLDLSCYCRYLLGAAGINSAQIQTSQVCTYCAGPEWGSYRRRTDRSEQKKFQYSWISLGSSDSERV